MAFQLPYVFKADKKEVVIQHKAGGDFNKFLRVKPGALQQPDSQGGQGEFARWIVEFDGGNGSKVRLKSKKSGKYLRIMPNGEVNVNGGAGPASLFKVHTQDSPNKVKLESNKFGGKYVSVKKNGDVNEGNGGSWTELKFFRQGGGGGGGGGGNFTKPYQFLADNKIVIQHKKGGDYNKFLRVNPNKRADADADGGKGKFAQMQVDVAEKEKKVRIYWIDDGANNEKRYLRIGPAGNINFGGSGGKWTYFKVHKMGIGAQGGRIAKLESVESAGKYVSVKKDGTINVGNGGSWTELQFFRN